MTAVQTPLRRSKRGQPALQDDSLAVTDVPKVETGTAISSRATKPEDMTQLQLEKLKSEDTDIAQLRTLFFSTFTLVFPQADKPARVYGKKNRTVNREPPPYNVGDTVLVKTIAVRPSVAVITAVWKVMEGERELFANLSLQWFIRPVELPKIGVQRSHEQFEVFYTLSRTDIMPLTAVVDHCTVHSAHDDVPEAESLNHKHFSCTTALDPRRGIYYEFNWDEHRKAALKATNFGESVEHWHVMTAPVPETPRKVRHVNDMSKSVPTALSDVEEEDEGADVPKTPSRRKRKNRSQSASPSKRRRTLKSDEADETTAAPDEGSDSGDDVPLKQTPRRQRLQDAASTPRSGKPRGRPKKKPLEEDEGDKSSDYKASAPTEDDPDELDDVLPVPSTPSRRGRRSATSTPRKKKSTLAAPTPHSKAALRARATRKRTLAVRPPAPDRLQDLELQLENVSKDPWLRAMHVLHVSARPEATKLPCREEEYAKVLRSVEELLDEGSGGCIYISGVPGTGKTATVHAVVRELKRMAEQNEANPFSYVEINGLRIPEPSAAYGLLWEAVSGHDASRDGHMKIGSKEALKQLTKHFSQGERVGPASHACVVLMDELDQLMTTKQDVVYNFFNWPTLVGSKLVVLAVANTMDLPERVMTGRVRSRLGMVRINFQPYTTSQLEKIVRSRLAKAKEALPEGTADVIAPDGIKFAAMKVSSISGDARRVLDICRRTVELVQPQSRTARTDDVKRVIHDMQNSPTAAYIRELSFHERLMLAALLRCIKKDGIEEIKWGDIQRQHLLHMNVLAEEEDTGSRPTSGELGVVLDSLAASRAVLCEEGALVARRPEDERRIVLNLEHTEVERVLGEVGGTKWKNALNI